MVPSRRYARYLDRWSAAPDWREAIALRYDHTGFDAEADAHEADEWANARIRQTSVEKRSLWDRLGWISRPQR